MENINTIIEIGSFSIKTIIYSNSEKNSKIEGIGKSNTQGYNGNEINSFDEFIESIKKSLVQAEKQANLIIKECYVLLGNKSIKINKFKNSLTLDGSIVENNDLRKLSKLEIKSQDNFNQNFYTSHYQIDNDLITDNPLGISCNKLSMISLISMIDKKQINIINNIFQKLKIKIINYIDTTTSYFVTFHILTNVWIYTIRERT